MNIHGERYASVEQFIGYCRDLNVETSKEELEHYENTAVMLPVARIIYPDEYIIQEYQNSLGPERFSEWPGLVRLTENIMPFPYGYINLSDEELIHCFDREIAAGGNPYLSVPNPSVDFRRWNEYRVTITDKQGNAFKRPTVEHYYAYWQVHQLHLVQQYPDLLYLNGEFLGKRWSRIYPRKEEFATFRGRQSYFDALSFWITVYAREQGRTFASVPEINNVRRLDKNQGDDYRDRLVEHAHMVKERFNLDIKNIHEFLRWLVDAFQIYERRERYKLSMELKEDIFQLEGFYRLITGRSRDETAGAVWENDIHGSRAFRHLAIETKERDYAFDVLNQASGSCVQELRKRGDSEWQFSESDVNGLLDYCEREGLGLLLTTLSGMMAIGNEEYRQNFRRVWMYTNLKNVLTSYEYLLKDLAEKNLVDGGNSRTLTPLVKSIASKEGWAGIFEELMNRKLVRADSVGEFMNNLDTLISDQTLNESDDGFWAQAFSITCLARNGTVHLYPTDDRYYGDMFGLMLNAVVHAMFYTWKMAQANLSSANMDEK